MDRDVDVDRDVDRDVDVVQKTSNECLATSGSLVRTSNECLATSGSLARTSNVSAMLALSLFQCQFSWVLNVTTL